MKAQIDYDLHKKTGAILFHDLNAVEFDRLRILFKAIFDFEQFPEAKQISADLGMAQLINQLAVIKQKEETQKIIIDHPIL